MKVIRTSPERTTLATDATHAESRIQRARGYMFRAEPENSEGMVFTFPDAKIRSIHMLFVRFPLDVIWVVDETVEAVKTLPPWTGISHEKCDTVIELPQGAAEQVSPGDQIELVE